MTLSAQGHSWLGHHVRSNDLMFQNIQTYLTAKTLEEIGIDLKLSLIDQSDDTNTIYLLEYTYS